MRYLRNVILPHSGSCLLYRAARKKTIPTRLNRFTNRPQHSQVWDKLSVTPNPEVTMHQNCVQRAILIVCIILTTVEPKPEPQMTLRKKIRIEGYVQIQNQYAVANARNL